MKLETEASGDHTPETKKTKEGSGRSSFKTDYSHIALEVKSETKEHEILSARTKAGIIHAFEDTLSSSSIQLVDDDYEVIGKWCRIIQHDTGDWDIWLIASNQKITYLLKKLPQEWCFKILDGEAWCYVKSAKEIVKHLSCLGIKRKRRISDETRDRLRERMASIRKKAVNQSIKPKLMKVA